jgi:O-glycosyl hydrolase
MLHIHMLAAAAATIFLTASAARPAEEVAMRITIDASVRYQQFEGFGQGHMGQHMPGWYARYPASVREKILDALYTTGASGLGLKFCRFCVPVGDDPTHDHMRRIPPIGNMPFEPEDGKFEWAGHEADLWYLKGAQQRGAAMYASWYGLPYWLTVSGCSAGSADGNSPNLPAGKEDRFATHICQVLKNFKDAWDIDFQYVSPINEPEADWWKAGGPQPGCAVTSAQAVTIYKSLKGMLPRYGLSPRFVAYDAAYLNTDWYLQEMLRSPVAADLPVIACHQYITSDEGLAQWRQAAEKYKKRLWMSEWGDWTNAERGANRPWEQAMNYAGKIHEAFDKLRASAWIMWEPRFIFDETADGLVPRKAYWVIAQYSRFVRPGMHMIAASSAGDKCRTTAWLADDGAMVIVTLNDGPDPYAATYDIAAPAGLKLAQLWRTSQTEDLAALPLEAARLRDKALTMELPAGSVTTLILHR